MKNFVRVLLVVLVATLSGACGGGTAATPPAAAVPAQPAADSHDWDTFNWDEGSFAD